MNVFDQAYDLSSTATIQGAMPATAKGFIVLFEADLNGNLSGSISLFLGAGTGGVGNRLCTVSSGKLRAGTVSAREATSFTVTKSSGAQGIVRIKFTDVEHQEKSEAL